MTENPTEPNVSSSASDSPNVLSVLADYLSGAPGEAAAIEAAMRPYTFADVIQALSTILTTGDRTRESSRWPAVLASIAPLPPGAAMATPAVVEATVHVYQTLGGQTPQNHLLLVRLAQLATVESLDAFVRCYVEDPPRGPTAASACLLPLFAVNDPQRLAALFPRLLDAVSHPEAATGVLDLANFLTRREAMRHPAADRVGSFISLAEATLAQLETAQTQPPHAADSRAVQAIVAAGVPLAVSLADALGLIGDSRAIPTLERIAELSHRRLRVEAYAALLRMGQAEAGAALVALASDPSVRLRVVAYAEELAVGDQLDETQRTPVALAEAELYAFLSQPTQMGVPPAACALIDTRTLAWPGYEEPRTCYLFRFEYPLVDETHGPRLFSNVGIAGPLAHAFHADLADLPLPDIYAAFAGWQAEHEEIAVQPWTSVADEEVTRDLRERAEQRFESFQPEALATFFGDRALLGSATQEGAAGSAVVDATRADWYPSSGRQRPIGVSEAFFIYVGRRLLRSFNPDFGEAED